MSKDHKILKRSFIPGEEWLYYKIYCGEKTADKILVHEILPLTHSLYENEIIDKWFYIRYNDPDFHLRIRFHIIDHKKITTIIEEIKNVFKGYLSSNEVWKVQIDTYTREVERYGDVTIPYAEDVFFTDSCHIVNIIKLTNTNEERFVEVFHRINQLIKLFNLKDNELLVFLKNMLKYYKDEFNANKQTTKSLYKKHNALKPLLKKNVIKSSSLELSDLEFKVKTLLEKSEYNQVKISKTSFLSSIIHMSINRTFRLKQRLYELLVYDFLVKNYEFKFKRDEK
jgi:thiopeptide-type bacteriocin biosynthesis protein